MRRLLAALVLSACSSLASALDYRTLSDNAIAFDANSRLAKPQFILLRGTPVEQLVVLEGWVKIREAGGGIGWVERTQISDRPQLIVTAATANVRQAATGDSPLVFIASRNLLLEPIDKPSGAWIRVRHRDGRSGFIELRTVWGR